MISTTVFLSCSPDARDLVLQRGARQRVERAERLVQQQHLRDPSPARAPRDTRWRMPPESSRGRLSRAGVRLTMRDVLLDVLRASSRGVQFGKHLVDGQADVLEDGQPRQQRVVLEHDAAVRPGPGDRLAVQRDRAGVGRDQPGDQRDERRLARARVADDGDELAALDRRG